MVIAEAISTAFALSGPRRNVLNISHRGDVSDEISRAIMCLVTGIAGILLFLKNLSLFIV